MKKLLLFVSCFLFFNFLSAQKPVLYGMTYMGGTHGTGTIIMFNPNIGRDSVMWNFGSGIDGQNPAGDLVYDAINGLFYGMTAEGGKYSVGTIFTYNPTNNKEDTVYSFKNGTDGQYPAKNLVYNANNGLFYGTTSQGGNANGGAIISFNPINNKENVVWSFGTGMDGKGSNANLVYYATNGLYYTLTSYGGKFGNGAIVSFNPIGNVEDTVYSFKSGTDGKNPADDIVYYATNGLFYGMTAGGGKYALGTIFSFNPTNNVEDTIHSFGGGVDGAEPINNLVYYPGNGLFYSMTYGRGKFNYGTIFSFNPTTNLEDTVYSFRGGIDGASPQSSVLYDPATGLFYGMTDGSPHGSIISFNPTNNHESMIWRFQNLNVHDGDYPEGNFVLYTPTCTLNASASALQNVLCHGGNSGNAKAVITGGVSPFTYSWSNGSTSGATGAILSAGSYTVTVADAYGCSTTASIAIKEPLAMSIARDSTFDHGDCDGHAGIIITGGTSPYSYLWTGGGTNDTIMGKCGGIYCCQIKDNNGCRDSVCVHILLDIGINNISRNASSVEIFPNPTNGIFTISGVKNGQVVDIYNYLGQKVNDLIINNATVHVDISDHGNGIYLVRIINMDGTLAREEKIVKTN